MWVRSLGQEDPLGARHGNPLQYSCLGNPMDRAVHRIAKNQSRLKQLSMHVCMCIYIYIYIFTTLYPRAPGEAPYMICYLYLAAFKNFPSHFIFN